MSFIKVYLDDAVPEELTIHGLIRCGSVIIEDELGNEREVPDLVDNKTFRTAYALIRHVSKKLNVCESNIEIVE